MNLLNTYSLEIKKSKFIAFYYEVTSKEEVKKILEELKKEHKKARHIPYAYILEQLEKAMTKNQVVRLVLLSTKF